MSARLPARPRRFPSVFAAAEIPDAQLDEIAAYLKALRRNGDDTRG